MVAPKVQAAPKYRAFISYSHRNASCARWLHRALETYRVPRAFFGRTGDYGPVPRTLGRVFRDEEELPGAAELGPKLQAALREAGALIVICSVEAVASQWVDQEIRYFRNVNPDRPVLALIANGVPGSSDRECFPESLLFGVDSAGALDRAIRHEPLAPDLQKLDRDGVKLKLIAGLLGISYGELARRDLKRARRRMAYAGGLATAVIAALAVLSVVALTYAKMAVTQRDIARHNAEEARHNAEVAERKAWLANIAAETIRAQADQIGKPAVCPPAKKTAL